MQIGLKLPRKMLDLTWGWSTISALNWHFSATSTLYWQRGPPASTKSARRANIGSLVPVACQEPGVWYPGFCQKLRFGTRTAEKPQVGDSRARNFGYQTSKVAQRRVPNLPTWLNQAPSLPTRLSQDNSAVKCNNHYSAEKR